MKLRNKKTGIIGELHFEPDKEYHFTVATEDPADMMIYKKLAGLYAEWEDYEEPKGMQWVDVLGANDGRVVIQYSNEEEAKKAVEKLKAWKRVKDGGITFKNWTTNQTGTIDCFATWGDNIPPSRKNPTLLDDLDLLFGGEK